MSVKISQYTDKIYLENCSGYKLIEIKYSGTFIADVVPEDVTIIMNKNTICIMDIGNGFDNQVFMNYYGNLNIDSIFYYEDGYKIPGGIIKYSDEVNKIKSKFDESTSKYEDFNKTNKYIKNVNSILSYKKAGRTIHLTHNKKYNSMSKGIRKKELQILKNLKQGVK
tara:strand:+ start:2072 stop:2572 length:501 start_codon:yes stop_codon:yes gene_type:complete